MRTIALTSRSSRRIVRSYARAYPPAGGSFLYVASMPRASALRWLLESRPAGWISLYCRGGISPLLIFSTTSLTSAWCWFQLDAFRVARPPAMRCCRSHEPGATLSYQRQSVRLLWQSWHAPRKSCAVFGVSHLTGRVARFACERPYGTNWISANNTTTATSARPNRLRFDMRTMVRYRQ